MDHHPSSTGGLGNCLSNIHTIFSRNEIKKYQVKCLEAGKHDVTEISIYVQVVLKDLTICPVFRKIISTTIPI